MEPAGSVRPGPCRRRWVARPETNSIAALDIWNDSGRGSGPPVSRWADIFPRPSPRFVELDSATARGVRFTTARRSETAYAAHCAEAHSNGDLRSPLKHATTGPGSFRGPGPRLPVDANLPARRGSGTTDSGVGVAHRVHFILSAATTAEAAAHEGSPPPAYLPMRPSDINVVFSCL